MTASLDRPQIWACTDLWGGKDRVIVAGIWKVSVLDAVNDEGGESGGDLLQIARPKGGVTFISDTYTTCHIILAPDAPFTFTVPYDDSSTAGLDADQYPRG